MRRQRRASRGHLRGSNEKCIASVSTGCGSTTEYILGVYILGVYILGFYILNVYILGVYVLAVYILGGYVLNVYILGIYLRSIYLSSALAVSTSSLRGGPERGRHTGAARCITVNGWRG